MEQLPHISILHARKKTLHESLRQTLDDILGQPVWDVQAVLDACTAHIEEVQKVEWNYAVQHLTYLKKTQSE
jgi:hypothetical protein